MKRIDPIWTDFHSILNIIISQIEYLYVEELQ